MSGGWNAQHLAGIDLVRIGEHGFVGFENLRILVGRAVKLFADFREVVSFDHRIPLRNRFGCAHCHLVVHPAHVGHVAATQHHLFAGGIGNGNFPDFLSHVAIVIQII